MKYLDISMELNESTVVWKDDPAPKLMPICRMPEHPCNFTWLDFSAHAGTHVDAPYYLFSNQWTSDQIPLERLIGRVQVLDLSAVENTIKIEDLRAQTFVAEKILLKTRNSFDASTVYNPAHVNLDPEAANYLVQKGVTTLGYDYQTFEKGNSTEIHRILLSRNITLIDNLKLGHVPQGIYFLLCLPIKLTGIDAAPARAILLEENIC